MKQVDIDEAHAEVGDILDAWRATTRWGDAPPFSGGVWDWPHRLTQGLVFLKHEMQAVTAYLKHQEEAARGSPAEHQR
jgi:hypothetical protein